MNSTEFSDKMDEYESMFGSMYPTMIFRGFSPEEMFTMMDKCIKEKKDVYRMGFATLDEDIYY